MYLYIFVSCCSFVWTTENGNPATPEGIEFSVEKEFSVVHLRLVLQSEVVEKEKLLFAKWEEDKTKAQYLIGFRYMARNDWKETMLIGICSTDNDTSGVERDFVKVLDHMISHSI